jgi:UDP-N-acetyl-D-glucosamine dehydrogenase
MFKQLESKIIHTEARVIVMGLGYVGLPLAAELAKAGFKVTGYDPDTSKVARVNRGESYVEYPTSDTLAYLTGERKLWATADPYVLGQADIVIICVPTPLNKTKDPDLSLVNSAVKLVAQYQHPGMLVVLESTSYPGTTRELLVPQLTRNQTLGDTIFVAYSPERIDPGNHKYNLTNTPKVVAGVTPDCTRLVQYLYFKINEQVVPVTSVEVAEMTKILENTFRAVNIGLVNELALNCKKLGIDPFEVIDAAATKPYGFMPFYPGPGLGGHCIPVDPLYLSWKLRSVHSQSRFIELAHTVNSGMPDHVISVVTAALNDCEHSVKGANILLLGVAYKPNVSDVRESPVVDIIQKLLWLGADVEYEDPHVPELYEEFQVPNSATPLLLAHTAPINYGDYDVVIITTPHSEFNLERVFTEAKLIVDTRGVLRDRYKKPVKDPKVYRI